MVYNCAAKSSKVSTRFSNLCLKLGVMTIVRRLSFFRSEKECRAPLIRPGDRLPGARYNAYTGRCVAPGGETQKAQYSRRIRRLWCTIVLQSPRKYPRVLVIYALFWAS